MYKLPEEIKQDDYSWGRRDSEEEEGGKYIGDQKMDRLASMLGVDKSAKGQLNLKVRNKLLFEKISCWW
jgi:hypothetical protein